MESGEILIWKKYELVILQIGINDMTNGETIEAIPFTFIHLCYVMLKRNRDLEIIINAVIPCPRDFVTTNPIIYQFNNDLEAFFNHKDKEEMFSSPAPGSRSWREINQM